MKLPGLFTFTFLLFVLGCATPHRTTHSSYRSIEEKYSHLLGVDEENISNTKLYSFIDDWYGVPYKYAGNTKKGVDCSGFTIILYKEVFGKVISGTSASLYNQSKKLSKEDLHEGDLVFFKIDSKEVSHIGIYLQNNKFVHATTKAGVMIDDLNEEYYRKYFTGGGKIE
jgi:lipoprotein Spr